MSSLIKNTLSNGGRFIELVSKQVNGMSTAFLRSQDLSASKDANMGQFYPMPKGEANETLRRWPKGVNPHTGEIGGPAWPEPTRYGDWERKGRVSDF